jgi:hypothetical protein
MLSIEVVKWLTKAPAYACTRGDRPGSEVGLLHMHPLRMNPLRMHPLRMHPRILLHLSHAQ